MACLPRFNLPEQPQYVIPRGNNREPIFCQDDDYRVILFRETSGNLMQITYPSGRQVDYLRDAAGQIIQVTTT